MPAREEACLQDEITCSSDSLSDHLAGETRTETMVVGGATAWLELRRYDTSCSIFGPEPPFRILQTDAVGAGLDLLVPRPNRGT